MEKAFGKTETNAQFFYELLNGEGNIVPDDKIDGTLPDALAGGPAASPSSANNPADKQLQGHEVVAAAFNRLTKYYPKITTHFQSLGLDLGAMLAADGTIKPDFIVKMRARLEGKDSAAPNSALSYQAAQLYVAEREGISARDPDFAEKFKALMDKPATDREAELKKFYTESANVAKLVRWAFRYSEFSLIPFKDQVELFKSAGFDEAVVKSELGKLWQGRSLPKLVSQAALLRGLELEELAKTLEGDAAQKKIQEARFLFRASVELDNQNPLARRRLSTHLLREGKMEAASFHLAEAVKSETETRYLVEIAQGLAIAPKNLMGSHSDPWAFVSDNLIDAKRFDAAASVYQEAAKAAKSAGNAAASEEFAEKALKIDETGKPFELAFTEKQNPIATVFYKALRGQGLPSQLIDSAGKDASKIGDRKIEAVEIFAYLDAHWKDDRVQRALASIHFPALPWDAPGDKPAYVDAAFEKLSFPDKMAVWHVYEIGELKKKTPVDEAMLEKRLRLASYYQPQNSERHKALGDFLLEKKRYSEAVIAYEAVDSTADPAIKTLLGHAYFGAGDFKASRDMYTAVLEKSPKDLNLLKLRLEANQKYLPTLDVAQDADAIKAVQAEIGSDGAMVLAMGAKEEKEKLAGLEKLLGQLHDGDGDKARAIAGLAGLKPEEVGGITKKDAIAAVEGLAQNYLSLADQSYADPKDTEMVRKELNDLAAECFSMLSRFAAADGEPEVQRMAKVYEGYALIAQGKIDEGVAVLTPLRKIPQADRILKSIEKSKLRLVNLSAVETWMSYNKDLERAETDSAKGWMSRTSVSNVTEKWSKEHAIAKAVKEKLESGEADSMEEALKLLAKSGDATLKERADYYLSGSSRANGTGPIGDLVAYASGQPPSMSDAQRIMAKSFDNEAQKGAVESAFAFYSLIQAASPEEDLKKRAQSNMDALQGKAGFGRSVEKFFKMHSGEGLAFDIGLMFVAAGLGNLAKLRMLTKLEQAGVNGYKAVAIANAVGIGTEATLFWGGGTLKEAMFTDPSKVFTAEHLAKGWASSLIMIGGLKGFGKLAEGLGPRAAKSLGLMKEGGQQMTFGGKALVWGIGHAGGLGGMIASSHVNQGLGLTPKPLGGWKEGLVNEVFGYVQFAVAHKVADGVVKGKMTEISKVQHNEIAFKEALLVARGHAETLGYKAERFEIKVAKDGKISANGKPIDDLDAEVKKAVEGQLKKDKDGKAEDQVVFLETPEHRLLTGLFLEASLNRPGFSGGKLTKLLAAKDYPKANEYLKEFQLPLHFQKDGTLVAGADGEPSPHEILGVVAPDANAEGSAKSEGEKSDAAKGSKPEALRPEDEPVEISGSDVISLEEGMTPEPDRMAARKGPPPKPTRRPPQAKPGSEAISPKRIMPEGLRKGVAINADGKVLRIDFNESGVAYLDASARPLSPAESQKIPHVEIQMALTEDGKILHSIRSVGAGKLRVVDAEGKAREVTATFKPMQDGDRLRLGDTDYTWFGPHGQEALEFKTKTVTVFEGRVLLEESSKVQERRDWAEAFVKNREKDFIGRESMFGDPGRIFADRVARDPRMSDLRYREAFVARCIETLEALKPILEKIPEEQRQDLAFSFLKQVIGGQMMLGDAKALAKSVQSGNLVVEGISPEQGKTYDYLLVPAFKGLRLPKGASMLEGLETNVALDFQKSIYVPVQFGDATLQFQAGMPKDGKAPNYRVMKRGGAAEVQIWDAAKNEFRTLPPRVDTLIQDGTVIKVGDRSFIFRSSEWVQGETNARNDILSERDLLITKRSSVQSMPDGAPNKAKQIEQLEKMERSFLEAMEKAGRDRDGVSSLEAEMAQLALGSTEFSEPARKAIAGKLTPAEYRKAQTDLGKKLVAAHSKALSQVSAFLIALHKDDIIKHRFATVKDENGSVIPNPHTRLKDPADIAPKIARRGWIDSGPLTDVGGARVVVQTTNDVLSLVEAIERKFEVRPQVTRDGAYELDIVGEEKSESGITTNNVTLALDKDHPDRLTVGTSSGYRAMHVVVEVDGKPIEIQIQTEAIFQWGKIQHSLVYKNKNLPPETLEDVNIFCREAAKYLTELENGPQAAKRPALPLIPKNLSPSLREKLNADLRKMGKLMDHYEMVAQDQDRHKTQIFKVSPGSLEVDPGTGDKTQADSPKAKDGGRLPQRRALAEDLGSPVALPGAAQKPSMAPTANKIEIPLLRSSRGEVLRLPADKAVVTMGGNGGGADIQLHGNDANLAPIHAEIFRGTEGDYRLRPLEGKVIWVREGNAWRKIVGDGENLYHSLKSGDRIRIGNNEFTWEMKNLPPLPAKMPTKPPPLPSAKGYEQVAERADSVGRELTSLVEVSDATLRGETKHWESSFANSRNPDPSHISIRGSWRHLSKADYLRAKAEGNLKDLPAKTYEVRILGEERHAQVEARLKQKYGPRLERLEVSRDSDSRWLLRNEKGEAQVEIVLIKKNLQIPTSKEAREIFQKFSKEQLPFLAKWLEEGSSPRSFYAFRMAQMLGIEGDGQGGYRIGESFAEALLRFEKANDPRQKAQAGEELATMLAYLQDARLMIPEHQLLHASTLVRDSSTTGKALAYAMRQGGELRARGETAMQAFDALRPCSDRLRSLGEELRRDVSYENQKPGNPVYDEYISTMKELRNALRILRRLEIDLTEAGIDIDRAVSSINFEEQKVEQEVDEAMILESLPLKGKRDLHGADDQPMRDLRQFSDKEIDALRMLGFSDPDALQNPRDPRFASHVSKGLGELLQKPHKSREYESAVLRLVGALRHWEMFGGRKIPWLDNYLRENGRNSYGVLLQSMPTPVPPPPRVPLGTREQEELGVHELRPDNVMQVISDIRSRSTSMERMGDFIPFRPDMYDRQVLKLIMDNYGSIVHAANPRLGLYLAEMCRPKEAYIAPLDNNGESGNGGKLPKRQASMADVAAGKRPEYSGEPTGAYVENIPMGGMGMDLKSLAGPRPSYVSQIPGLTAKLEKIFDRGGRVEDWPQGKMLVEAPSGAETRLVRPATPAEAMAYLRWSQHQGFRPVAIPHAQAAWGQLNSRAKELGISIFLGEDAATGALEGKKLETFLQENSGQVAYLNALLQRLPASLILAGGMRRLFLRSPRQENAFFGAYDAADASLYLYSGAFQGSRRNLAALFLHEIGHPSAERYRLGSKGDANIPDSAKRKMTEAHATLARDRALFAQDWGQGAPDRMGKQARDFDEFIADLHIAYVASGPALRAHIRSFPEGSPARQAWDFVYSEMRDRVFGGLEYDFAKLPPPPKPKPGLRGIPGGKATAPVSAIQAPEPLLK